MHPPSSPQPEFGLLGNFFDFFKVQPLNLAAHSCIFPSSPPDSPIQSSKSSLQHVRSTPGIPQTAPTQALQTASPTRPKSLHALKKGSGVFLRVRHSAIYACCTPDTKKGSRPLSSPSAAICVWRYSRPSCGEA